VHTRSKILVTIFPLLLILISLTGAHAGEGSWREKVQREVLDDAAAGDAELIIFLEEQADLGAADNLKTKEEKGRYVFETLSELAARTQMPIIAELEEAGIDYRSFWAANMIAARGGSPLIEKLARRTDVRGVFTNRNVYLEEPFRSNDIEESGRKSAAIEWNLTQVGAPSVWALGNTGVGAVVGGIDTGYEWDHPALKEQYRGWDGVSADHNYNWHDAIHTGGGVCGPDSPVACDDHYHGTHTMGTIVGDDSGANRIGVAPGAKWIGCRCMDEGDGTPARYTECLQWMIAPTDLNDANADPSKAPHVINNSWSCPDTEGCIDPLVLLTAVNNVRAAGIVVVASANNSGPDCSTVDRPIATYDATFSIGATADDDEIAYFSSRGNVTIDGSGRLKPDVSAPGVSVRSSVPGFDYASFSGTSMAAPHVAGLAALLVAANPALAGDVDQIETIINGTALPRTTTETCGGLSGNQVPNNTYGWGRIDALAAHNQAALIATDIRSDGQLPLTRQLAANRPNPFNPSTLIEYTLPERGDVTLRVYDVVGRLVRELVREIDQAPGRHTVAWDGFDDAGLPAPSGLYFYRLESDRFDDTRRMLLVR